MSLWQFPRIVISPPTRLNQKKLHLSHFVSVSSLIKRAQVSKQIWTTWGLNITSQFWISSVSLILKAFWHISPSASNSVRCAFTVTNSLKHPNVLSNIWEIKATAWCHLIKMTSLNYSMTLAEPMLISHKSLWSQNLVSYRKTRHKTMRLELNLSRQLITLVTIGKT